MSAIGMIGPGTKKQSKFIHLTMVPSILVNSWLYTASRCRRSNGDIEENLCSKFQNFNLSPKSKFNNKIKELGLHPFLHYCS